MRAVSRKSEVAYVLGSTALALVLAIPVGAMAIDLNRLAFAPVAQTPVGEPAHALPVKAATSTGAAAAAVEAPAVNVPNVDVPVVDAPAAAAPVNATEPSQPPDPLAALDPADRAIAEKLRELLATKVDKLFPAKKESAAIVAFYQERNLAPLWLEKGVLTDRGLAAIAKLKGAAEEGLDPADYKVREFAGLGAEALAAAELTLTQAVLTYARHVQAGRFPYARVSRNIELPQAAPEPADVLMSIAKTPNAAQALEAFSPQHTAYRRLKAALAELRAKPASGKAESARQIDVIIANMERWRWYPRELGAAHVQVNLPDFTLKVMHNGAQAWTTRVVIGKPSTATPLLSETMKYITVNPTWTVPQSIVRNEYLPALAEDPTVLERMGLRVSYNGGQVQITQPPGDGNALGRIRFSFPNRFSVYHHDTPDKGLFAHDVRAYSHGCMRVQDPAKYAEVLLNIARPREGWTAQRIKSMFGRAEQDIHLPPAAITVHLTYQTAFVDDAGKLQFRRDVYGLDTRTLAAMKRERGTPDAAPARKAGQEIAATGAARSARPARSGTQSMLNEAPVYGRPLTGQPIYR
ncbi:MAG: murein L,D-transpeptidase [Xanthobacteraceae bacterium]